jgi:hypothetical protein
MGSLLVGKPVTVTEVAVVEAPEYRFFAAVPEEPVPRLNQ